MILRIFKTSQPLSWILIVILISLVRVLLFATSYSPPEELGSNDLFAVWITQFNIFSPWASHIISTIIVLLSSFYLNKISQSIGILNGINYLLVLFTGIFMSFYPVDLVVSPMIISAPILLYSYHLILDQPKGNVSYSDVLNSAIFIGVATLIFFPSFIMLLVLLVSLGYLNQSKWRPFVIGIIGFCTPWLFFDSVTYAIGYEHLFKHQEWLTHFVFFQPSSFAPYALTLGVLILIILESVLYFRASSHSIIKTQKLLNLNYIYLLFTALLSGFLTDTQFNFIGLLVIPISILFTVFHLEVKRWWFGDIAFIALLGLMYISYFGT